MSKEAKKEPNEEATLESQQETNEMSAQHTSEEKTINITGYLALHEGEYESDVALFFKNKFRDCVKTEKAWGDTIADFLEKSIV